MDDAVWAATSFGENRERLFSEAVMREFFRKVLALGEWKRLISHEHFTADGTLIEAWASMKRFVPKDGGGKPPEDGGKNPSVDFKGKKRKNDTHASTTDPKGAALQEERRRQIPALLHVARMKYALMENRNGLVVDAEVTQASGTAEREAALRMVKRSVRRGSTLGADKAIAVDTQGLPHAVAITTAEVTDRKGAQDARPIWFSAPCIANITGA